MERCPTEVLRSIIEMLIEDEHLEDWLRPRDLENIRSLRFVDKRLSSIASEYLYREVLLTFHAGSYQKMVAIAQHPTYRYHVRRIRIKPKAIPGPLLGRQQFGDWLHGERNLLGDPRLTYFNGGYCLRVRRDVGWQMPPQLDDAYHEYKQIYLDQAEFQPNAEAMLQSSICQFAGLTHVLSGAYLPDLAQFWLHEWPWHPNSHRNSDVNHFARAWKEGVAYQIFDTAQAKSVLKAVGRGQTRSGAQIDITSLLQDCDTRILDFGIDSRGEHLLQDLTANIGQLRVLFNSFSMEGLTNLMTTGKFTDFLARLTKLSNLTCSTRRLNARNEVETVRTPQTFGLTDIFANKIWPRLATLKLERFLTAEAELMDLLARHKSSLRSLSLQDLLFSQGSWYAIFTSLRGGALQQLDVYHLGYRNDGSRDYDKYFLNNHISSPCFLAESDPLYGFVIQNKAWDDSIAAYLETNRRCWGFLEWLITGI